jgi:hypothetical protein
VDVSVGEQRRQARTPRSSPHGLRIDCYGRQIPATLVDVSEGGFGVETLVALPFGDVVKVEGEFENEDFAVQLTGTVRVVHCSSRGGVFRAGLAIVDISYRHFFAAPISEEI